LGAAIAGVASVESLRESPSHRIYPKIGMNLEVHWRDARDDVKPDEVAWPANAVSAVVIGVAHNADEPELDWWDGKGTPGNRILVRINKKLSEWIENTFSVKTYKLPYLVEKGGIFLKDAAVMAGLGCIGKNNLVITPGYGPASVSGHFCWTGKQKPLAHLNSISAKAASNSAAKPVP